MRKTRIRTLNEVRLPPRNYKQVIKKIMLDLQRHTDCPIWSDVLSSTPSETIAEWTGIKYACQKVLQIYCKVFDEQELYDLIVRYYHPFHSPFKLREIPSQFREISRLFCAWIVIYLISFHCQSTDNAINRRNKKKKICWNRNGKRSNELNSSRWNVNLFAARARVWRTEKFTFNFPHQNQKLKI